VWCYLLDYGAPSKKDSEYGAKLVLDVPTSRHPFVSISDIQTAVQAFIDGYVDCESEDHAHSIAIAVSINNCVYVGCPTATAVTLDADHGEAWAKMIEDLRAYATPHPEIQIAGGIDAEPGFDPDITPTSNWLNSFLSNTAASYYNFGSTDYYNGPVNLDTKIEPLKVESDHEYPPSFQPGVQGPVGAADPPRGAVHQPTSRRTRLASQPTLPRYVRWLYT
jgi:hypothetical protein